MENAPQKNKMIERAENKDLGTPALEQYFYSGGMEYEPITISAHSQKEADELWLKNRVKVEQK